VVVEELPVRECDAGWSRRRSMIVGGKKGSPGVDQISSWTSKQSTTRPCQCCGAASGKRTAGLFQRTVAAAAASGKREDKLATVSGTLKVRREKLFASTIRCDLILLVIWVFE